MAEIKVAVLGGEGCGKRSLLTCMDQAFREQCVFDKRLTVIRQSDDSFALLDQKHEELECCFSGQEAEFSELLSERKTETAYHYRLEYGNAPLGLDLCVTEFPHINTVEAIDRRVQAVADSQIVLLVIDTPALMENPNKITRVGQYQQQKNRRVEIENEIKEGLLQAQNEKVCLNAKSEVSTKLARKFLLIVPVKCEKYEAEERLGEVLRKIKEEYKEITDLAKNNCTCAVVPVQTLGNAKFERFEEGGCTGIYGIADRQMAPHWADLVAKMVLQYVYCELCYYLKNPKVAKSTFGQKLKSAASEEKHKEFRRENAAIIDNMVDKQKIAGYEVLTDTVELNIIRKLSEFNVLMFGPRRAGKSSVLASMLHKFDEKNPKREKLNNLSLQPADEFTKQYLESKRVELADSVEISKERLLTISMTEAATDTSNNYVFEMHYGTLGRFRTVNFMDIPGERLMGKDDEWDKWLKKELNNCQIIIIAIDTPHLMEQNGDYNENFNHPAKIFDLIKKQNNSIRRLFLLVPIKCEKYFYEEGGMEKVNGRVKQAYGNLLRYLEKRQPHSTVAITPILTMGGVVFDSFELGQNGFVNLVQTGSWRRRPEKANYKRYEKDPTFKPQFCEQPMYYLLSFILANCKKKAKFWDSISKIWDRNSKTNPKTSLSALLTRKIVSLWEGVLDDAELQETAKAAKGHLRTTGYGYELIQDPQGLGNKKDDQESPESLPSDVV